MTDSDWDKMLGDTTPSNDSSTENTATTTDSSNNDSGFKKTFKKVKSDVQAIGTNDLNMWNHDSFAAKTIDKEAFTYHNKIVTLALPSRDYVISDSELDKFKKLLGLIKSQGFKVRFTCTGISSWYKIIVEELGITSCILIAPWKNYCKELGKCTVWLPSDDNIRVAGSSDRFDKWPSSIKYINSAVITVLCGPSNTETSTCVITHDSNYDGDKLDFSKSKDNGNIIITAKRYGIPVFNISKDNELKDLVMLLRPKTD